MTLPDRPRHAQLQDLLSDPQTRISTIALLHQLRPLCHEPLREACERAHSHTLDPLSRSTLRALSTLPPLASPSTAPLTRGPAEATALLEQLEVLLFDLEQLTLLSPPPTPLQRLSFELIIEAARGWVGRGRADLDGRSGAPADHLLCLSIADLSERLGERVLRGVGLNPSEELPRIARELSALSAQEARAWQVGQVDLDDLVEIARHPGLLATLRRVAEESPPRQVGAWRDLLSARVPAEALADVEYIAARLTPGLRRSVKGVEFELAYCPPGDFLMGAEEGEGWRSDRPQHVVHLSRGLWVARTTVTRALWAAVMGDHGRAVGDAQRPVDSVSWYEALRFCNTLSALEGLSPAYTLEGAGAPQVTLHVEASGYRLPTEAEWEYAARAGGGAPYAGGEAYELAEVGWCEESLGPQRSRPVGGLRPNAWGLYDMTGNVWEWCFDSYLRDAYKRRREVTDPITQIEGDVNRVIRGGAYFSNAAECRVTFRSSGAEGREGIGFRLVRG